MSGCHHPISNSINRILVELRVDQFKRFKGSTDSRLNLVRTVRRTTNSETFGYFLDECLLVLEIEAIQIKEELAELRST